MESSLGGIVGDSEVGGGGVGGGGAKSGGKSGGNGKSWGRRFCCRQGNNVSGGSVAELLGADAAERLEGLEGRGLHSSYYQLNPSRFGH